MRLAVKIRSLCTFQRQRATQDHCNTEGDPGWSLKPSVDGHGMLVLSGALAHPAPRTLTKIQLKQVFQPPVRRWTPIWDCTTTPLPHWTVTIKGSEGVRKHAHVVKITLQTPTGGVMWKRDINPAQLAFLWCLVCTWGHVLWNKFQALARRSAQRDGGTMGSRQGPRLR